MFQAFYGMTFNPFHKDIPEEHLFASRDFQEFRSRMEYFQTVRGFALVYGRPGTGKTASIRAWTRSLNPQLFQVVYLPLANVGVSDFYRNLARGLGLVPAYKKVDLFYQIQDYIVNLRHQKNRTPLVILDEAQFLSHAILGDLLQLFNFQMDSQDHAMVLLCGQAHFVAQLNLHIHEPLRQRIMVHYEFKGLAADEVGPYLTGLLKIAGVVEPLFAPEAVEAMATTSTGSPRVLNALAEKALLLGYQRRMKSLDAETIRLAHQELALFQA